MSCHLLLAHGIYPVLKCSDSFTLSFFFNFRKRFIDVNGWKVESAQTHGDARLPLRHFEIIRENDIRSCPHSAGTCLLIWNGCSTVQVTCMWCLQWAVLFVSVPVRTRFLPTLGQMGKSLRYGPGVWNITTRQAYDSGQYLKMCFQLQE